ISLLRGSRPRSGVAGAAADAAAGAVFAHVGDAGRHGVFRRGTDATEWQTNDNRRLDRTAGAAGVRLFGAAAGANARKSRGRAQKSRLYRTFYTTRSGPERAGFHKRECLHARG